MSDLLRLDKNDFIKGAVTAVFTAVVAMVFGMSQQPNFDIFMIDWHQVVNAAVYGFIGYIGKNLATDADGKILGMGAPKP